MMTITGGNALRGFQRDQFCSTARKTHDIYRIGFGPAIIVIHEVPGITPLVADIGRKIADRGMTAVLPDLFGTPGRELSIGYALGTLAKICVNKEFNLLATNKNSPVVNYLRELAAHEREAHGGPGVGAPDIRCVSRLDFDLTHALASQRASLKSDIADDGFQSPSGIPRIRGDLHTNSRSSRHPPERCAREANSVRSLECSANTFLVARPPK